LQYLAAPGNKSRAGLLIATGTSAVLPLNRVLKQKPFAWDAEMVALNKVKFSWWARNSPNIYTALFVNGPRSFAAAGLSCTESTAAGAEVENK
jgi:hypothetical protein